MNFIFPFSWECHHPNWLSIIFFRGVAQPPTRFVLWCFLTGWPCSQLFLSLASLESGRLNPWSHSTRTIWSHLPQPQQSLDLEESKNCLNFQMKFDEPCFFFSNDSLEIIMSLNSEIPWIFNAYMNKRTKSLSRESSHGPSPVLENPGFRWRVCCWFSPRSQMSRENGLALGRTWGNQGSRR
jgi:hypothetical protein